MPNGESLLPYRPHIIYNLADDWAWPTWPDNVGGLPRAMLPNVADLFVDGALTLDQHYAARACAPSRRSLLSGRFVHAIGSHNGDCPGLPLAVTTLPEVLRSAGYRTHLIGKFHAGFYHSALPRPPALKDAALGSYSGSIVHSSHCRQFRDR